MQENEQRYRRLIESTTDYLFSVQVEDGRPVKTTHGRGCVKVTGYTAEEYDADPDLWYRMIFEADRPAVLAAVETVLAGGKPRPFPHRIIHKDGGVRWVGVTLVPRTDDRQRVVSYDGLIRDITERKLSEETVIESERHIRQILDSMNTGVFIIDAASRVVVEANSCALAMIGADKDEVVGRSCREFLCPGGERDCPAIGLDPATGAVESVLVAKSGREIPILKSVREIERKGKKFYIESFFDIEERKKAAEEREKLLVALQDALSKVKLLSGFLPICASCKKIRDDKGYWNQIETYIRDHSEAEFSHGLCPECARRMYPRYFKE